MIVAQSLYICSLKDYIISTQQEWNIWILNYQLKS